MRKRLEVGSDIAMIGVWDVAHERPDLSDFGSTAFSQALESEARKGRLFFINTGGDGSCDAELFIDEEPPQELLDAYAKLNRRFLVQVSSGTLLAGGIEDFVAPDKPSTPTAGQILVAKGSYSLAVHELKEKLLENDAALRKLLGDDDYVYYSSREGFSGWFGCLTMLIVVAWLILQTVVEPLTFWYVPVIAIAAWLIYRVVRPSFRDERFESLSKRVRDYVESFPYFIFVLTPLPNPDGMEGGWYDL